MNILIIGGTIFLGRHLVEAALACGHTVTLFNRGKTNSDLYPEVEKIRGDRTKIEDFQTLRDRHWNAVIDTCGYYPHIVQLSAQALAGAVERYVFISSISVYGEPPTTPDINENSPVSRLENEDLLSYEKESYGNRKALCEQVVENEMPGRTLIIRPGLIVGPNDPSDRFTYWPGRLQRGGTVLAPGNPDAPVQIIDVRDLAEWTIRMIEYQQISIFNATGPSIPLSMRQVLEACRQVAGTPAELVWMDDDFLLSQGVAPFTDLPLWLPSFAAVMHQVNIAKAINAGLTFRPLAKTIADTLAWDNTRLSDAPRANGISPERESELIDLL
ncbi:MAG: NAD-dependent epimerase/dehydratase family protein [Anaerolineaceae bacterium]|jgi:2'-hydroxyisoflavone reductase|nr:NAD-dependent epimerase/dehydratase family protein [Anaerolineaceae bacterium]